MMSGHVIMLFLVTGITALLVALFKISHTAKYYIKFSLFLASSMIFATAPIPLMLLRPFDPRNALLPSALLRMTEKFMGIRFHVRGVKNVDDSRGCVVLINHQSGLDLYIFTVLWPLMARGTVVAKKSLQYVVPFGTAAWLWGTVYIDRGAKSSREILNQQAEAVKIHKRKLFLFPEGTRHSGDELLPFRKGAFHVAVEAGAPIQPVVVSKYYFVDGKRKRFDSGDIIISILPMIETTKDMTKEELEALVEKTRNIMQDEFTRNTAEAKQLCTDKSQ